MAIDLNPADWAVLGVLAERPAHGFAMAQVLAPDGPLGQVWTVPRPVVYQVLKKLCGLGLIAVRKGEPGERGPARTVFGITPIGRRALRSWLSEPVEHVRDVRSQLLLKLALLHRAGLPTGPLLLAQKGRIQDQVAALSRSRRQAEGFDRVVVEWRLAGSRATLEFIQAVTEPPE